MFGEIKLFGLSDSAGYAAKVAQSIGIKICEHEESVFDDGEFYLRSKENVRGHDVFVICSLFRSHNDGLADKVLKVLFFTGSLRDASAGRITLVFPYLSHQRQDRKNKSRAPVYTKYIPMLTEAMRQQGDRTLVLDPHNLSALQSANRMACDHIEAKGAIAQWLAQQVSIDRLHPKDLVVLSPDEGGVKRARFCRDALAKALGHPIDIAYVDKIHENDGTIEANAIIGTVTGKHVIIFDDMLSSGKTMKEANDATRKAGGKVYAACATHGLFVGKANSYTKELMDQGIKVVVTDSVEPYRLEESIKNQLVVIPTHQLLAESIRRIHNSESVSSLIV